jgi:FtsH-binding integral membrane protein
METLQTLGLILIIVAWLIQLITVVRKSKNLSIVFVWAYFIGILLIAISNAFSELAIYKNSAIMNLIVAVLALLTIIAYQRKKEEKPTQARDTEKKDIEK